MSRPFQGQKRSRGGEPKGNRGGCSGGAAIGGQGSTHLPFTTGRHDRGCVWCGKIIESQNLLKSASCSNRDCQKRLPLRSGFDENGWGRCCMCDSFLNREFLYCQFCQHKNQSGFEILHARKQNAAEQSIRAKDREIERLRRQLQAAQAQPIGENADMVGDEEVFLGVDDMIMIDDGIPNPAAVVVPEAVPVANAVANVIADADVLNPAANLIEAGANPDNHA